MGIRRTEDGAVLNDESGDPEVVRGNGGAFLPELQIELGVLMRRLFVRQQDGNAGTLEKSLEIGRVGRSAVARGKTRAEFAEHD